MVEGQLKGRRRSNGGSILKAALAGTGLALARGAFGGIETSPVPGVGDYVDEARAAAVTPVTKAEPARSVNGLLNSADGEVLSGHLAVQFTGSPILTGSAREAAGTVGGRCSYCRGSSAAYRWRVTGRVTVRGRGWTCCRLPLRRRAPSRVP